MNNKAGCDTILGLPSGFVELDRQTNGWKNGDFVVLASEQSLSKTIFTISIAKYLAVDNQLPIAYFSLAQAGEHLIGRLVSNVSQIEYKKIHTARLEKQEWDRVGKAIELISNAPLYIQDKLGLSISDIKTIGRYMAREKGIRLIIIDNLQLINVGDRTYNSRQEEYAYINRELKSLSSELNIPILLICEMPHLQMTKESCIDSCFLLEQIHEFGAIEQYADMVLFLLPHKETQFHRESDTNTCTSKIDVMVAKFRNGSIHPFTLYFQNKFSKFESEAKSDKEKLNDDIPF